MRTQRLLRARRHGHAWKMKASAAVFDPRGSVAKTAGGLNGRASWNGTRRSVPVRSELKVGFFGICKLPDQPRRRSGIYRRNKTLGFLAPSDLRRSLLFFGAALLHFQTQGARMFPAEGSFDRCNKDGASRIFSSEHLRPCDGLNQRPMPASNGKHCEAEQGDADGSEHWKMF